MKNDPPVIVSAIGFGRQHSRYSDCLTNMKIQVQCHKTHVKMPEVVTYSCNASVGEVKTMDSWQSLVSQPILTYTFQKREKLSQKNIR